MGKLGADFTLDHFYKKYVVLPDTPVSLSKYDPNDTLGYDKKTAMEQTLENSRRIARLQNDMYSEGKKSLLIVLQALDAGGKDGTINNVFAAMNPQGCRVESFKVPTRIEAAHDFLWRIHAVAPQKGEVVIFNRSHYESVLVERVHQLAPADAIERRYQQINHFEELLAENGTKIVKFYLHIDKDEQLRRFISRLEQPEKHWKISGNDYPERQYWDQYIDAFEIALSHCSTSNALWFVVPANNKWFRNLVVSQILLQTLESMNIKLPEPSVDLVETRRLAMIELERQCQEKKQSKP